MGSNQIQSKQNRLGYSAHSLQLGHLRDGVENGVTNGAHYSSQSVLHLLFRLLEDDLYFILYMMIVLSIFKLLQVKLTFYGIDCMYYSIFSKAFRLL